MERNVAIGQLLREKRLEREWGVETVAELYGKAVRGTPMTGSAIFTMEEGRIPGKEQRRWVLARILNIPPTALGLKVLTEDKGKIPSLPVRISRSVDISEYQTTLRSYRMQAGQGYKRSPESALRDLGQRIYALHDNAYYVSAPQRDQMKRLLWGYHVRRSYIAKELSYYSGALDHLNKALILAQEEKFADLEATTLYVRGQFFFERRDFSRALQNLKEAQSKIGSAPQEIRGAILRVRGLTDSYLAKNDLELSQAIRWIDAYEHHATLEPGWGKSSRGCTPISETDPNTAKGDTSTIDVEQDILLFNFTEVQYAQDRAKALIAPKEKALHLTEEAYTISDEIYKKCDTTQKRLHAYHTLDNYIILAQYYLDKGYYAMATTQIEMALSQMEEMNSLLHLPTVVHFYEQLTETSYGKEVAVAELGLHLLFVQYPGLFKK